MTLRHRIARMLDPELHPEGLTHTNKLLVLVILAAAASAILETEPTIVQGNDHWFLLVEWLSGLVFITEYLLRLWIVPENPHWKHVRHARLRYALTPAAIIDLLAVLPTLMALEYGGSALLLRFFRVLRILRLAKLGRMSRAWTDLVGAIRERRHELLLTVALAVIVLLFASTLMYWAEAEAQPDKFGSIPRAMWWCIVTLTTVGYGDVYPVTVLGKFMSGLVAVAGIGLIAMPTGILAAAFSDVMQRHREEQALLALDAAADALEDENVDKKVERKRAEKALKALEEAEKDLGR